MPHTEIPLYTHMYQRAGFWRSVRQALHHRLNLVVKVEEKRRRNNLARSLMRVVERNGSPAIVKRLPYGVAVLFL